ncbi:MAG: ABC transporter permease [Actinomycetota bacterium]|nr:ABC transporter permease [Actinomycetota bacterium]
MKRAMTIYLKEMMDTVRDRRTLIVMILMPMILMPTILIASVKLQEWSSKSQAEDVVQLMITGEENAPELVGFLAGQEKIELVAPGDAAELLKEGEIDANLVIPVEYRSRIEAEQPVELTLQVSSVRGNSQAAADKVALYVSEYGSSVIEGRLEESDESLDLLNTVTLQLEDTASEKEKGGTILGYLLPMFLVIFAIIGGMYTAIDVSAGEKERKTLEPLLMTPSSRTEIVSGKFLAVATVSIVTIIISVAAIYVSAAFITTTEESARIAVDVKAVLIMLPVALLLAAMFAALLLAISIYARSFKEAQNYITPLYIAAVLPVIVANTVSNLGDNLTLFVIPGFNAVVLFRELLVGDYALSHILITVTSMIFFTWLSIRYAVRIYSRDDVLFDEQGRRGPRSRRGFIFRG